MLNITHQQIAGIDRNLIGAQQFFLAVNQFHWSIDACNDTMKDGTWWELYCLTDAVQHGICYKGIA